MYVLRLTRTRLLLLAVLVLVALGSPREGQAECQTLDRYWQPRECTLTEEFGSCLANAYDSYYQCWHGTNWLGRVGCFAANAIDNLGCVIESPMNRWL